MRVYRQRREERERRVVLAAAEAADDDEDFAVDDGQGGGRGSSTARSTAPGRRATAPRWPRCLGDDLMVEWARRLDDFDRKGWHNICEIQQGPTVEYVGLVNRADDSDDRVTVRVDGDHRSTTCATATGNTIKRNDSTLDDHHDAPSTGRWASAATRWILALDPVRRRGPAPPRRSPIVASPWGDDERLRDEAVTELATADSVPDAQIAEIADLDFDGTARAAALDLAMVDGRFAPDVLEAAVRRAVEAWSEAVDGEDAALERAATPGRGARAAVPQRRRRPHAAGRPRPASSRRCASPACTPTRRRRR